MASLVGGKGSFAPVYFERWPVAVNLRLKFQCKSGGMMRAYAAKRAHAAGRVGVGGLVALLSVVGSAAAQDGRLVDAVKNRDAGAVATLLKQPLDVNLPQPDGATALHWAAHWDDVALANRLVRAGAHVNAVNDYGVTPLFLACNDASAAMIETLLQAGANPNVAKPNGETALMVAARTGKLDGVKALLARGADVNAKETLKGQTGLMWAVAEHHLEVARTLIAQGADVRARSNNGSTPLLFAARAGDIELARLLLTHGADVNEADSSGTGVLLMATVRGHVELAQFLLNQGADPNADSAGYTALHWAAGKWETEFTSDYSYAPGTTAEWAAVVGLPSGKLELIEALLAHGANVNARLTKRPPQSSRTLFKQELLRGATPFYLAALVGDTEVMRLLLAHGADPGVTANDKTTPLMVAAGLAHHENRSRVTEASFLEATRLLVGLGADINAVNNDGWTALHAGTFAGHESVVQFLLDHGARLNEKTKYGQTALGIAEGYCPLGELDGRIQPRPACIIGYRPAMAAYLSKLGAVSAGRVQLDSSGQLVVTSAP
jgi:ankyrin repeat protein